MVLRMNGVQVMRCVVGLGQARLLVANASSSAYPLATRE
jgi:hypothetical protein